jgi:hypothetical protein
MEKDREANSDKKVNFVEFRKIMIEFIDDLRRAFPELSESLDDIKLDTDNDINNLYIFCKQVYPSKFFDIVYQNSDLFKEELCFLPEINFCNLWKLEVSDQTRETIWKYLQLILFTIVGLNDKNINFGDTASLFEAIPEAEFKTKLEETIRDMEGFFKNMPTDDEDESEEQNCKRQPGTMPDVDNIHDHLKGMMDGKIGGLAKEIAEEAAKDLNIDEMKSTDELFKKLFQNPTKLMDLVKNVGSKLETKLKSGDFKESELLQEATQLMNNMKDVPGMGNLGSMFSKMGGAFGGQGGSKMNMGDFESKMQQQMKQAKMRERMQAKLAKRAEEKAEPVPDLGGVLTEPLTEKKPKKKRGKKKKKKTGK